MRFFLAALARSVRAGEIEVHAYCLMATHFHLLLRSPLGRLSRAMHRVQLAYSRYFNRGRGRDGPLVRGRFRSKTVESLAHRVALVSYIDWNPVEAGIVDAPARYPHGSAIQYLHRTGPKWLERSWIEESVVAASNSRLFRPADYLEFFGREELVALRRVIGERNSRSRGRDSLDDLIRSAPTEILTWMRRQAHLADGTRPGLPVAEASTVEVVVDRAARDDGLTMPHTRPGTARNLVRVALFRELCGLSQASIANRIGLSRPWVSALLRRHRDRIASDPVYAKILSRLAHAALADWRKVLK